MLVSLFYLVLGFVAEVGFAQRGEEKVFSWTRFQVDLPVRVCILKIFLQARVFRVIDQDHAIHVVGVALRILDKLKGEVEAGPEDEDGGDLSLESAGAVDSLRHHWLVRHLVGLACDGDRGARSSFKIYCKVRSASKKFKSFNLFEFLA